MNDKPKLNLAERRAVAAYQESIYTEQLKQIIQAAGFDVAVDVDWGTIAVPGQSAHYQRPDYWTDVFFTPLIKALEAVTADALGKEALQGALKTITIHFEEETAPSMAFENGVRFAENVLTINFRPFNNADCIDDRVRAIQAVLEAAL